MVLGRPLIALISLIFTAGGILLLFFTILPGAVNSAPLNQFYFLEANNIGNIPGARDPSRWTLFAICGVNGKGHNANCGSPVPALPFDPPRNFGTRDGIPGRFIGTHKYYYMSRFAFAFFLMALVFSAIALFTGLLALCSRLGGYISGLSTGIATFFQAIAASLVTAWAIQGRNAFNGNGQSGRVGTKMMAFVWTTFTLFFLSTLLFCCGGALGRDKSSSGVTRSRSTRSKRSTRSNRGSFFDNESQRRMKKDDYS
ncbi:SUR7-domain-containing protein [Aaosphaeria arxii CBS 175.79]|uniref:SUR7-domain-containing protein n=1 Tax=Aaosphaeria arxii CBS 175.79 TaxID=1450172 RepID=A0A6A5Y8L0_9PLEO|nr:SUR7-domain-containing protein [Aaosphaeria arxii CBS 175.79]KAF2021905.1 SUR7-domain-containing protein [Aaosphaeria arxii CBS 175.79]